MNDRPNLEMIARTPFEGQTDRLAAYFGDESADAAVGERKLGDLRAVRLAQAASQEVRSSRRAISAGA